MTRADVPRGALTIDLEDYFHVSAFDEVLSRRDWPTMPSRVVASTERLLALFAEAGAKATFFCLGVVAEQHPTLIARIAAEGHEIASHGYGHQRVNQLTAAEFAADITRAKALIEDAGGVAVQGYRAPSFSINAQTPWAHAVLAETGHRYSSSSHPIRHDHYGDPTAPRGPHWRDGVLEIPVSTLIVAGRRITAGGGGFFRLLPQLWFAHAARRLHAEGLAPNFYLHPWEIDPDQPRINGLPTRTAFRHYLGLRGCAAKLRRHLRAVNWQRMDVIYARQLADQGTA